MPLLDPAFLLRGQLVEDLPKVPSYVPKERLFPALGNEHDVVFALPLGALILVHRWNSLRVLGGSRRRVSSMGDR
jgi:hypothetical protein